MVRSSWLSHPQSMFGQQCERHRQGIRDSCYARTMRHRGMRRAINPYGSRCYAQQAHPCRRALNRCRRIRRRELSWLPHSHPAVIHIRRGVRYRGSASTPLILTRCRAYPDAPIDIIKNFSVENVPESYRKYLENQKAL